MNLPESALKSWDHAWHAVGASGDGHAVRDRLVSLYSEPHRRYHSIQHLTEVLSSFAMHEELAIRSAEVALALWFHDAIYEPKSHNNEERSAELALQVLTEAGTDIEIAKRVEALVLITQHTAQPKTVDEMLLVDLDLSILASSPARYAEYEAQIRQEYDFVPEAVFAAKRQEILMSFMSRTSIFHTPKLHELLEGYARRNLQNAIELWSDTQVAGASSDGAQLLPRRMSSLGALVAGYVLVGIVEATESSIQQLWKLDVIVSKDDASQADQGEQKWAVYTRPDAINDSFWAELGAILGPMN